MHMWYPVTLVFLLTQAAESLRFAALSGQSSFFLPVEQGWNDQCNYLGLTDCPYITPDFSNLGNGTTSADVCEELILNLLNGGLDGLALGETSCDGGRMAPLVAELQNAGIPVVLFDRDFVPNRTAYIGTDNVMMGATMARLLKQLRPEGGSFVIVADVADRTKGFITEVTKDNDRDDRAHWHEIKDSTIGNDMAGPNHYADIMDQYAKKHNPTAFVIMRQTPMRYENWTQLVDSHRHRGITIIGTDGSDYQLSYLHRKYVDGLIGQLPYEFGYTSLQTLYDAKVEGKKVPSTVATNLVTYNLIPLELPDLNVDQNLLHDLKYVGWVCFGIIALCVILCIIWTYVNRGGIVVRASQPAFLVMTAIGVLIMGSAIIPLSFDDNGDPMIMPESKRIGICMSIPWLAFTGFTVAFCALFSKTWRINKLLSSSSQFLRVKVETRDVIGPFFALISCNWIVLLVWTFLDPLKYDREFLPGTDFWNREFASAGSCQSENPLPYLVLLGFLNLFVLVLACYQAFKARNIQTEFSEATYIGLSIYTLVQAFLSGIPIVIIVREIPIVYYLVLTFLIFLLCMAIIVFIFVPKISLQNKYKGMSPRDQQNEMAQKLRKSMAKPGIDSSLHASNESELSNPKRSKRPEAMDSRFDKEDASKFISAELRIKKPSSEYPSSEDQVASA